MELNTELLVAAQLPRAAKMTKSRENRVADRVVTCVEYSAVDSVATDADNEVMLRPNALLVLLVCISSVAAGQSVSEPERPLQRGFSSVTLGMGLDAVKQMLQQDDFFRYRGDPDVSLIPSTNTPLIDAAGRAYIRRGLFQFRENQLYLISLVLDGGRIDYFSVYESLVRQYGEPDSLSPQLTVWTDDQTRISLERPLTVKYTDVTTFDAIVEEGQMLEALEDISRDLFLEQL